ncbi:hypothetical protein PISMIDRAFT_466310 [Pisolithus microcarpus 441]|uniref:Uncharacterized protein n=1 Tax=Pisolithus microcarpus 441 TaxID=765257 RepID=A0A0C9ZUB3_9AGAM|nr:hypothetical protein BKA83DRAFT_466310 [Pisolithus microcarpus]KIK23268.1 hypothetical protein PISMIDRAFT_466310 [Pisolithus microcarpus 441]
MHKYTCVMVAVDTVGAFSGSWKLVWLLIISSTVSTREARTRRPPLISLWLSSTLRSAQPRSSRNWKWFDEYDLPTTLRGN